MWRGAKLLAPSAEYPSRRGRAQGTMNMDVLARAPGPCAHVLDARRTARSVLAQLTIRDFAIIDRLTIEWSPGLNVVTGETGAGKSIIIDAVGALLGGRVTPDMVRTGATRATVEGVFDLSDVRDRDELHAALEEHGLELEDGGLILTRDVAGSGGRGVARINGRAVPTAVLQQVGEHLVDIHGQSEHLSLLRPREHLELLDRYAGLGPSG